MCEGLQERQTLCKGLQCVSFFLPPLRSTVFQSKLFPLSPKKQMRLATPAPNTTSLQKLVNLKMVLRSLAWLDTTSTLMGILTQTVVKRMSRGWLWLWSEGRRGSKVFCERAPVEFGFLGIRFQVIRGLELGLVSVVELFLHRMCCVVNTGCVEQSSHGLEIPRPIESLAWRCNTSRFSLLSPNPLSLSS